jgi:hypothetical protein
VPRSVLEAIRSGIWDYEPEDQEAECYDATRALPGSNEKLEVMARRIRMGLPLWHPKDCRTYEATEISDL